VRERVGSIRENHSMKRTVVVSFAKGIGLAVALIASACRDGGKSNEVVAYTSVDRYRRCE
jgi:hypothetical protein